jgi:hypothetical protein
MPLVNEVARKYRGPIRVVGGGMRALSDFEAVKHLEFAATLSANDHAFKIEGVKPDFIVCKDHYHTETKERMEKRLRIHGVPIISRHYWADHRLADWQLDGNSGIMALAVAGILGATEIYPIGFDFFTEGTHFHEPDAPNVSRRKHPGDSRRKAAIIRDWLGSTALKPVSGPLVELCSRNSPLFTAPVRPISYFADEPGIQVKAKEEMSLPFSPGSRIIPGTKFWLSANELKHHGTKINVDIV